MDDKKFADAYKCEFDKIKASDELRSAVKNLRPQKSRRTVTPLKATIGTVAAAFMIFAAVHEYSFEPDTSGVISETVVSTPLPDVQFGVVEKPEEETEQKATESDPVRVQPETKQPAITPKTEANTQTVLQPEPVQEKDVNQVRLPVPTSMPQPEQTEAVAVAMALDEPEDANTENGQSTFSRITRTGGEDAVSSVQTWTLDKYYDYLGENVSAKINGSYIGSQSMEFEVGSDGVLLDDKAVLDFATDSGASVQVTVSKQVLFDSSLSGTITETETGYDAYKVSGDIYYNIQVVGMSEDEAVSLINGI